MDAEEIRAVLHALRLLGFAPLEPVAARTRLPDGRVVDVLRHAETSGWVLRREGRVSGWSLTGEGRNHGMALLAAELDDGGARQEVASHYERFVVLNPEFLEVCTDWQLRRGPDGSMAVNDHTDPDHDRAVVERLVSIDDAVQVLVADIAGLLDRFAPYGDRLSSARERVVAGDRDWFTRPVIDSYHTVWFELHEDLLATLGLERSDESAAGKGPATDGGGGSLRA